MTATARALATVLALTIPAIVNAAEYYVTPEGDDAAAGTAGAPFATLTRARDAIREGRAAGELPAGGITVWLQDGLYQLEESFTLERRDSGTEDSPVTYRAVDGADVRVLGGRPLPAAEWSPVTSADVRARLPEDARDHVLQVDLTRLGVRQVDPPPVAFRGGALPDGWQHGCARPIRA